MPFRYLRDPLFVFCVALYFANRWLLKPWLPVPFLHDHLNDLICIPFWVPIMVWSMRRLRLRADDSPPQAHEVLIPLLVWSLVFEIWLPSVAAFRRYAVADPADILHYTLGALLATLFWRGWYGPRGPASYPGR